MSKSNNKKNRKSGVIESNNQQYPNPMTSSNTPTADLEYTDKERSNNRGKGKQILY